jgi:hypothetical protein
MLTLRCLTPAQTGTVHKGVVKCDSVCFTQNSEEQNQNMQKTAHRFLTSFDGILGLVVDATSNETKDTASLWAET